MKTVYGWLLLTPAAVLLVGFTHYPAVATLVDSLFSTGTVVRPSRFVGLGNYASLADDPIFWQVLGKISGSRWAPFPPRWRSPC